MAYAQTNQQKAAINRSQRRNAAGQVISSAATQPNQRARYRPPTAYSADSRPTSGHRTISNIFATEQYGGGLPTEAVSTSTDPSGRRTNGVRNPKVAYKTPPPNQNNTATSTSNKKIPPRASYNTGLRPSPQPRERIKLRGPKKLFSTGYKLAARSSLLFTYAWTGFLWTFIQVPLAILMLICIGIMFSLESIIGSGVAKNVFDAVTATIGVDWDFKLAALFCYLALISFCYLQLALVWLQCVSTGMHPTSGRGGGVKTGALLLALVLYWVPGLNILPLVWLWVFTISLYPR